MKSVHEWELKPQDRTQGILWCPGTTQTPWHSGTIQALRCSGPIQSSGAAIVWVSVLQKSRCQWLGPQSWHYWGRALEGDIWTSAPSFLSIASSLLGEQLCPTTHSQPWCAASTQTQKQGGWPLTEISEALSQNKPCVPIKFIFHSGVCSISKGKLTNTGAIQSSRQSAASSLLLWSLLQTLQKAKGKSKRCLIDECLIFYLILTGVLLIDLF